MNKYLILLVGIIMINAQKALCATAAVSPELQQSLKTHSYEPNIMSIISALIIVVFLIYITGLIYSKLNIVGAKTVQQHMKNQDLSRVIVLSTTQLGQGKNLHVIEINNNRYLIGATQNSINLIKELGMVEKKVTNPIELNINDTMNILYGEGKEKPQFNIEQPEEFDLYKKYL